MIIDPTDFNDRPYKIPNQSESRDFVSILSGIEKDMAIKYLLGYELWSELNDALESSGSIDPIYSAIRDGAEYEYNGQQYKYEGWVKMLQPAVMHEWVPNTTWKLTNIGFVENDAPDKSSLMDDQYVFQVKYWNDFVVKVGGRRDFSYSCINYENSFWGFMKVNEANYPSWVFHEPQIKNRHDI